MFPLRYSLSSLPWFLDVAEVVIVAAILKDEDVDLLEVDVARMEECRVPMRKDPSNAGMVNAVITSLRSAGRNLVDLSGHNYLNLILLLCVALLRTIHPIPPLFLDFSLLYWHMRSMIDFDN